MASKFDPWGQNSDMGEAGNRVAQLGEGSRRDRSGQADGRNDSQ